MKNMGTYPDVNSLVRIHPWHIHTKFEANLCSGLREVEKTKTVHNNDSWTQGDR